MPKTYIFTLAVALITASCTPSRPTAQARVAVSLPWSAQQLTDSLKYLLAHVVRMDTAQYRLDSNRVFSMRPGATVQGLTVVGPLNVLAAPDNGLPDTIHLPHDSIPHLPGDGLVGELGSRWTSLAVYPPIGSTVGNLWRTLPSGQLVPVYHYGTDSTPPTKKTKKHAKH